MSLGLGHLSDPKNIRIGEFVRHCRDIFSGSGDSTKLQQLYISGTLKRILYASSEATLYAQLQTFFQNKISSEKGTCVSPEILHTVNTGVISVIESSENASNDEYYWKGLSEHTTRILHGYSISPEDVKIPLSQLDSLGWIYDLYSTYEKGVISRDDVLGLIVSIPEILSIQLY